MSPKVNIILKVSLPDTPVNTYYNPFYFCQICAILMPMDLISPKNIKELLTQYDSTPSKGLGQNFLIDGHALEKIIAAADLNSEDVIVEVGPGIGVLTQELAKRTKKVIAIEKDQHMVNILQKTLKAYDNVEIICADALQHNLDVKKYKVIANIPYYITSPLIRKFLESTYKPTEIILMMQKEVAQRICAKVPDMNLLAVSVQFYASPKIVSYVSKSSFWPAPKIDSAIIKITPKETTKNIDANAFFSIVKAGFSQPRKQLGNNFSKALKKDREIISAWLSQNNINPMQRAETLSIADWERLTTNFLQ